MLILSQSEKADLQDSIKNIHSCYLKEIFDAYSELAICEICIQGRLKRGCMEPGRQDLGGDQLALVF